jgi:NAD(P)-dependent dehydrogenase (short-subunit alcohol dehydrogenase family)
MNVSCPTVANVQDLRGKTAVVTGAASGIGRAMVDRFLADGMQVVLADVEADALARAEVELAPQADRVRSVVTDVADGASVQALADRAIEAFGAVHLLCSNAGVSVFGRSWKFRTDDWDWVLGVNLWGVIHGIRTFVPLFLEQGEGHVVNTSSMVGVSASGGLAPYSVSKHGVVALSEALAIELRELDAPVGVSVLCPGFVRTRIGESERNRPDPPVRKKGGIGGEVTQLLDIGIPPAEVAELVLDAIKADRFWIFTHEEMLPGVEQRLTAILEGRAPEPFDLNQLLPDG